MSRSVQLCRMAALTALAGAFATEAGSAAAPLDLKGQTAVLRDLSACPKITDDAARLACFDKAAGALIQAETAGEVVVVDRQQAREVRRQSFGFQIPSLNIFARGDRTPAAGAGGGASAAKAEEEDLNRAVIVLASVGRTGDGKLLMTSEEGAVWAQTDGLPIQQQPRKGSQVTIVKGKVGGYFCDVSRYQSVRCERRR